MKQVLGFAWAAWPKVLGFAWEVIVLGVTLGLIISWCAVLTP